MANESLFSKLDVLQKKIEGNIKYDNITTTIYSTDASVYKEKPLAVIWPKNKSDIKKVICFAASENIGIITRAAGTSLAGQVVGNGIVMDLSRHMKRILEVNKEEMWVRVEPGVVLDELNMYLRPFGLFFGPETSTSNRCNIGGMVGNNSCGSHSIIYKSTREHVTALHTILSDGSEAVFEPLSKEEFNRKCSLNNLEGKIYRNINGILSDDNNRKTIIEEYPDPQIPRRNTGYAIDQLIDNEVFDNKSKHKFNFCKLLAGSEGTLAVTTEIKLNLVKVPAPYKALVCVHLKKRDEAFLANLTALRYSPSAVEMMDDRILELTKDNISQRNNRFFLEGTPGAILIVEFVRDSDSELDKVISDLIEGLSAEHFGYAFPVVKGKDITKVWNLRKAGLGVLSNMKGDAKPVSLIEDTAVNVEQMPAYIKDIEKMLSKYHKEVVYHAHIGSGELHIRPILNLKDPTDVEIFRNIGLDTARLVKKYHGSMSGEHGDGRLRGEFIPIITGEHNFALMKEIKKTWDPCNILNPNKIIDTPMMNTSLRYIPGRQTPEVDTIFDFSSTLGVIRAAEKCNGSGDCRKTDVIGGTMCPTFMATGDERNCPRARANIIREFISSDEKNRWDHREIYDILDLCISCKGCKAECPSGVDIAKLKAEFLQHWYDKHGIPMRTRLIAYISTINKIGSLVPHLFNAFLKNKFFSNILKKTIGFAQERSIPLLYKTTLRKWIKKNLDKINPADPKSTVFLFVDEFTDFNDTATGIAAIKLLTSLGYRVLTKKNSDSARTFLSKGLLRTAKNIARKNVELFSETINEHTPLLGIEPSAILAFRDEYPELVGDDLKMKALAIAPCCLMVDEFLAREYKAGNIDRSLFTAEHKKILLHAHCQQKAVSSSANTIEMLSIPVNYTVEEIPSGCCGMAGSFGFEKEHYQLSKQIGELVLLPAVRAASDDTIIAAPGTSCRHQIKDETGRTAKHPVEILYEALCSKTYCPCSAER